MTWSKPVPLKSKHALHFSIPLFDSKQLSSNFLLRRLGEIVFFLLVLFDRFNVESL